MKKKVYVLMVSKTFPATHPRRGEPTYFMSKILLNFDLMVVAHEDGVERPSKSGYGTKIACEIIKQDFDPKLHTIRGSYELWKKRADKINAGEAVLSLRQWSGEPYKSKQVEFMQLEKIGIQRFGYERHVPAVFIDSGCKSNLEFHFNKQVKIIAKNDGLSLEDWKGWFPKSMSGVIIHFTDFRYGNS